MADRPVSPMKAQESATTREEMDFDDNELEQDAGRVSPIGQESHSLNKPANSSKRVSFQEPTENPPAKPPRPLSPRSQTESFLIEMFPSVDVKLVKTILIASDGKRESAVNALLYHEDPSVKPEDPIPFAPPPPQPKIPIQTTHPTNQMEQDEQLARQLAEQDRISTRHMYNQRDSRNRNPNRQKPAYQDESPERDFLGEVQEGFQEARKTFTGWIDNFAKKIDGDGKRDEDDLYSSSRQNSGRVQGRQNFGPSQSEQLHGINKLSSQNRTFRRSTEEARYDADPHVLGDDEFERLELRDEDDHPPPQPPRTSSRKQANPDLFKPQPKTPYGGPVDEVDAAERKTSAGNSLDGGKERKWQPLTSVAPAPEEDNDPFSLGDDDEDKDKSEDLRKEDTDRLKEKARESVSAGMGGDAAKGLEEHERSGSMGTRNKEAEDLLKGDK